jgi:hypothetical protein
MKRKFAKKICRNWVRKIGRFVISAKQLFWGGKIITQRHTNGILSRQETWGLQEHNLSTKTNIQGSHSNKGDWYVCFA